MAVIEQPPLTFKPKIASLKGFALPSSGCTGLPDGSDMTVS